MIYHFSDFSVFFFDKLASRVILLYVARVAPGAICTGHSRGHLGQPMSAVAAVAPMAGRECTSETPAAQRPTITVLAIHERDITPEVCRRCAACCQVDVRVPNTDSRYRRFLRGIGLSISPPISDGKDDCCDNVHEITVHLGPCSHLRSQPTDGATLYSCMLYDDLRRPQLCEQYNCVSWAKANNAYNLNNAVLSAAQRVWVSVHRRRSAPTEDVA